MGGTNSGDGPKRDAGGRGPDARPLGSGPGWPGRGASAWPLGLGPSAARIAHDREEAARERAAAEQRTAKSAAAEAKRTQIAKRPAAEGPTPVEAPTPALPKGGGALRSIAEKFGVAAATGAGSMAVPLALPGVRGGPAPALALRYSTGSGNGPYGIGWSLDLPTVTRKTEKGIPTYRDLDDSDTFILSGFEELVPLLVPNGDEWARDIVTVDGEKRERFRPRVEGAFARIERVTTLATKNVFWRATTKDNVTSTYGRSESARIADPEHPRHVFSWLLEETKDDRGNVVRYVYKAEDRVGVPKKVHEMHRHNELAKFSNAYLKRIVYGNLAGASLTEPPDATQYHFEVVFDYGEHDAETPAPDDAGAWPARLDPFSSYRAGFEVRTYRLCKRVLVFHRFEALGEDPVLVRSVDLEYDASPSVTYLTRATQKGYVSDGEGDYEEPLQLPPVDFEYSRAVYSSRVRELVQESSARVVGGVPFGWGGRAYQWLDLDGEGAPGILMLQGPTTYYKRNLGQGRLACAQPLRSKTTTMSGAGPAARPGQQLMNVTGSGLPDLVEFDRPARGYFPRQDDETFGSFRPFQELPNINWSDPSLRFIDLDGDGFADVMMSEDSVYTWWRFERGKGFNTPSRVPRFTDERRGPSVVFREALQTVFLADMTGDGLTDLVRVRNGSVCYWPNLGQGRFGAMVTMAGAPHMAPSNLFHPVRVRLADVDGTGPADLVYIGAEGVMLWPNQSGNSFGAPVKLAVFPDASALATVDVLDVLGNGTACLVWSTPIPGRAPQLRYVDLLDGKKPHLLTTVKNNLGLETRIAYTTSARLYQDDRAKGKRWATKLPFPVQVVERVEHYDHVSRHRFVQTYRYRHGFYDPEEREFRGFGYVETRDAEKVGAKLGQGLFPEYPVANGEITLPPVVTKTWYHTGAWQKQEALFATFEKEWYAGTGAEPKLKMPRMPPGLSASELHQAHRALAGKLLRSEVYAEDGTADASRPYLVSQSTWSVRKLQPAKFMGAQKPPGRAPVGSFLVTAAEALGVQYERQSAAVIPPRVTHELALEVDELGYVTKTALLAYARLSGADDDEQERSWVAATTVGLFHEVTDASWYRHGVPLEERSYELHSGTLPESGLASATALASALTSYTEAAFDGALASETKRLLAHALHRYWKNDQSEPLPQGEVESLALPHQTYAKALTAEMLSDVLDGEVSSTAVTEDGGYVSLFADGMYWAVSGITHFDASAFYQPDSVTDAFGNVTTLEHDAIKLFVETVTDAAGNVNEALHDYRVLQPRRMTDPNLNLSEVAFDALGRVVALAAHGADDEGDTLEDPTVRFTYETDRFALLSKPVRVKTELRETHADPETRWLVRYTYTNGAGAVVAEKALVEPGDAVELDEQGHVVFEDDEPVFAAADPRWVCSGRVVLDNKGNPVKEFEPYFSPTEEYEEDDALAEWGASPRHHYDPLGRLIRTDFPDGSFSYTTFNAWKQVVYDRNDTAKDGHLWYDARKELDPGDPELDAAEKAHAHADTPTTTHFDALGRAVAVVEHDNVGDPEPSVFYTTRTLRDIQGNVREVKDAKARSCMTYVPNMIGRVLKQVSIDAGARFVFEATDGTLVKRWGERPFKERFAYDALRRPTHQWLDDGGESEKLVGRLVYGELHASAATNYLRGKIVAQYDQAGVLLAERYDFKGNLLEKTRRLATDYAGVVEWSALAELTDPAEILDEAESQLEAESFAHAFVFDALNRPAEVTLPDSTKVAAGFNVAGFLESVSAYLRGNETETGIVTALDYDAHGRRKSITFANGTETTYTYDPASFRLVHFKTERDSDDKLLQSLAYTYDAVGNIVSTRDSATQDVFFSATPVESADRDFTYSAVYRLTRAEGREHAAGADVQLDQDDLPIHAVPHPSDPTGLRRYSQEFSHDEVGNILAFVHAATGGPGGASWTREYSYVTGTNRLEETTTSSGTAAYAHDAHGNMTAMAHLDTITWDFADRMRRIDVTGDDSQLVYFVYDSSGERVRKVHEHAGLREERIYLGGYELYRKTTTATSTLEEERQTVHLADDKGRVCMAETLTVHEGDEVETPAPRLRYQLDDHLGTACVEVDGDGAVISMEEFHPFGTSSYRASDDAAEVSAKRYRYTGKERDEETGLGYHGARYYAPWLGRWTAADPAGLVDGPNLYQYVKSDPIGSNDPTGLQEPPEVQKFGPTVREIAARAQQEPTPLSAYENDPNLAFLYWDPSKGPWVPPAPAPPAPAPSAPQPAPGTGGPARVSPPAELHISPALVEWMKGEEGFQTGRIVPGATSLGYGHDVKGDADAARLIGIFGPTVDAGEESLAEGVLRSDLGAVENKLRREVTANLTQGEWDGLVSLGFNGGLWGGRSTIIDMLNAGGDRREIAARFFLSIRTKEPPFLGKAAPGIVRRRIGEARMFLEGQYSPPASRDPDIAARVQLGEEIAVESNRLGKPTTEATRNWLNRAVPAR